MPIKAEDLTPEQRKALGLVEYMARSRKQQGISKDRVRGEAIRVLAAVAGLTQQQRDRVLRHALALNKV